MNTEIEREVIGIFLNHPEKVETSLIEQDWFVEPEYQHLFEAIRQIESNDFLDIYGKYNQLSRNPFDFKSVKQILNEAPPLSQLSNDVQLMKKTVHIREVNEAVKDYQLNPFRENEQKLLEALSKNETDDVSDDGKLDEAIAELKDSMNHPRPRGVKTFNKLDFILGGGMYESMLFTIGARPSTGKTAFSVNLAYEAMMNDKEVEVDFFTLEMNKQEMLNRFVSRFTGVSSSTLRSKANEMSSILKGLINQPSR
ncbi:DnaB-like helicase C-terminal domain-containing protein [Pediococcus pentosaceus]|uniref:DnaB-like helicase C-terminal domain-containing protein n=1 Tax=Pediococcus pentosaceus TaxID=1255 RepID=UPI00223A8194|nr:DnaB-like helicase C-terminal domain-containing protein [Pediococcus pentosaceus]